MYIYETLQCNTFTVEDIRKPPLHYGMDTFLWTVREIPGYRRLAVSALRFMLICTFCPILIHLPSLQ